MSLSQNSKLDPREHGSESCQAPNQTAIPIKRACRKPSETQFQPSGHGKIVEYEYTTERSNRNRIVSLAARLPGQSKGRGTPLAEHSASPRKRTMRNPDNHAVQILRGHNQGLPDHHPARVRAVDAETIRALESRNIFSVHDVRQLLLNVNTRPGPDWVRDEEISEEAKRIVRRCSRHGWIRPRASYPGQWEITAGFYLRPNAKCSHGAENPKA